MQGRRGPTKENSDGNGVPSHPPPQNLDKCNLSSFAKTIGTPKTSNSVAANYFGVPGGGIENFLDT